MRKIKLQLLFAFIALMPNAVQAEPTIVNDRLTVQCHKIANKQEQICYTQTPNPNGPFDDVVLYVKDIYEELHLLNSEKDTSSTFGGFDFTPNGEYMWLSWAEEGHPYFIFYKTSDFLEQGFNTKALSSFEDLKLDGIYSFTSAGVFNYYYYDSSGQTTDCVALKQEVDDVCIKTFNFLK